MTEEKNWWGNCFDCKDYLDIDFQYAKEQDFAFKYVVTTRANSEIKYYKVS